MAVKDATMDIDSILDGFDTSSSPLAKNADAVPDTAGTLEYLRGWTLKQDQITQQTVEHQKRMEAMIESLRKSGRGSVWREPAVPRLPAGAHAWRCDDPTKQISPPSPLLPQAPKPEVLVPATSLRELREAADSDDAQVSDDVQVPDDDQAAHDKAVRSTLSNVSAYAQKLRRSASRPNCVRPLEDDAETSESEAVDAKTSQIEDESEEAPAGQISAESDNWSDHSLGRLHPIFVDAIWHVPTPEMHDHRTWHVQFLEKFVENPKFEYFAGCFIIMHSIFIGISVEYMASVSSEKHVLLAVGNVLFVIVFCAEVGLKLAAERQEFIRGHEWKWNVFDLVLVTTVFSEVILSAVLTGKNADQKKSMKTVLKLAEMVRTVRILRIFRMLKFSLTLRIIVAKIISSARSLGWILILFALMVFVVSVCLTQGCNDFLDGDQHLVGHDNLVGTEQEMSKHFGSISRSGFTLFASIAGGLVWSEVCGILRQVSFFYEAMFVMFIALTFIAVMNLITGIFVGNAINSDVDLVMEAEAKEGQVQAKYLKSMFARMDSNQSGNITVDEFLTFAHNPELKPYLETLNIDPGEAETLFHLLDEDASGKIQIDEFLSACVDLRGAPRSIDIKVLLHDNKRMRHKLFKHVKEFDRFMDWAAHKLEVL